MFLECGGRASSCFPFLERFACEKSDKGRTCGIRTGRGGRVCACAWACKTREEVGESIFSQRGFVLLLRARATRPQAAAAMLSTPPKRRKLIIDTDPGIGEEEKTRQPEGVRGSGKRGIPAALAR